MALLSRNEYPPQQSRKFGRTIAMRDKFSVPGVLSRGVSYMSLFSSDGILRRSALAEERRCVSNDSGSGGGRGEFVSQLLSVDAGCDKLSQSR
jgi:hypothetical protein